MWWNINWAFLVMEGFPRGEANQIMQNWLLNILIQISNVSVEWLGRVTQVNLDCQSRKGGTKGALMRPLNSLVNPNHLLEKVKEIVFNEENES